MAGCSHHNAAVELRERLAFSAEKARDALDQLHVRFPYAEAVVLSTCNRVELYTFAENAEGCPSHHEVTTFLADFHQLDEARVFDALYERTGSDAVRHLFTVAASLDSMVVGEPQIVAQVKQAYDLARQADSAGPLTHCVFQTAMRVAKRVATETAIGQKRVSIPSVAVLEVAREVFEHFDDKHVLVIGAGEMGRETMVYLKDLGVREMSVVNRSLPRAQQLAAEFGGQAYPWEALDELLVAADFVVSTTGASEPVVTLERFQPLARARNQRTLLLLDLAMPRDFDPAIGELTGVYLYSIDDLQRACDENRKAREREWPKAETIIEEETARFMAELHHRATGPTIRRLKERAEQLKDDELTRLLAKLDHLDDRSRREIAHAFDRVVNKILHPPLESLRGEAASGAPQGLLHALKRLFQLDD
jgi:glutamyl-tRNA reductase